MPDGKIFTFFYKFTMTSWSLGFLLLGTALLLWPFKIFGMLMQVMPWGILAVAAWSIIYALKQKSRRKAWLGRLLAGLILLAVGSVALCKMEWRDVFLWYCFAGILAFSAWQVVKILRMRLSNKHSLWRYLGALTVWGMVILMLFKPQSGLSDALALLGVFSIAWGVFMLLLPSPEE